MKNKVTTRIRKLRLEKGISQENVADELGITHSSYSKIERGETDPNLTRLIEIAKILGVPVTDLFIDEVASSVKEPKEGYGESDLEKLNQTLQKLLSEIHHLRTDLSDKQIVKKNKSIPKKK